MGSFGSEGRAGTLPITKLALQTLKGCGDQRAYKVNAKVTIGKTSMQLTKATISESAGYC